MKSNTDYKSTYLICRKYSVTLYILRVTTTNFNKHIKGTTYPNKKKASKMLLLLYKRLKLNSKLSCVVGTGFWSPLWVVPCRKVSLCCLAVLIISWMLYRKNSRFIISLFWKQFRSLVSLRRWEKRGKYKSHKFVQTYHCFSKLC